jgi:hypothetical protein
MSEITVVNQSANQMQVNYDFTKVFIFENRYKKETFRNLTAGALTYATGTVVGRVKATNKITECKSGASDGSERPIGVLATDVTALAATTDITVRMCYFGDVAEGKLVFNGTDTLATVVGDRVVADWLQLAGIKMALGTELTFTDNQ